MPKIFLLVGNKNKCWIIHFVATVCKKAVYSISWFKIMCCNTAEKVIFGFWQNLLSRKWNRKYSRIKYFRFRRIKFSTIRSSSGDFCLTSRCWMQEFWIWHKYKFAFLKPKNYYKECNIRHKNYTEYYFFICFYFNLVVTCPPFKKVCHFVKSQRSDILSAIRKYEIRFLHSYKF